MMMVFEAFSLMIQAGIPLVNLLMLILYIITKYTKK